LVPTDQSVERLVPDAFSNLDAARHRPLERKALEQSHRFVMDLVCAAFAFELFAALGAGRAVRHQRLAAFSAGLRLREFGPDALALGFFGGLLLFLPALALA
jgi:hypothetical protein